MTTSTQTTEKIPLSERVPLRMIAFVGVLLLVIGYPVYIYVDNSIHGGIKSHGDLMEVDLKSMGNFPFDGDNGTVNDVPKQWRALDGKKVLLQGEVFAPNEAGDKMTRFELVYSIAKCCFGGPPKVQERVFAIVPKEMDAPNLNYQFAKVTGTLRVKVQREGSSVTGLYYLDVEKIDPL